jgi:hypothetical protein
MILKRYNDFLFEEINIKKALIGTALGSSMLVNSPAFTQTKNVEKDTILTGRVNPIERKKSIKWINRGYIPTDSIKLHYLKKNNSWSVLDIDDELSDNPEVCTSSGVKQIYGIGDGYITSQDVNKHNKVLVSFNSIQNPFGSSGWKNAITLENVFFDKNDFDSIQSLDLNKIFKFDIYCSAKSSWETQEDLQIGNIELDLKYPIIFYIKIGYFNGRKVIRFNFISKSDEDNFNFDKLYYEVSYDVFIKLLR